ncbi:hypothetical protein [Thermoplasma acidophilum]|uniref:Phosphoadenosine phosphosulphate reductase domain-containing protein n=1 Tax=Thermoplasma acidophilum (strain ATCC 25905 / DSM 1728 / JCM 9062 / NBRC 15155 / AMRC-C165) TaxID=273075 RepID=Q9HIE4_THEAC|nr:phosphoadenosine phosphosulfate reductase family protein [Thermoplasma acidophilum]CAC12516.1 hypothetical protein [Thermoplasma acidophilum]
MAENFQLPYLSLQNEKVDMVFDLFNKTIRNGEKVTFAFSGGKDSTTLAILFYEWLKIRHDIECTITLLHNDTSSEIDPMENWARNFMTSYKTEIEDITEGRVKINIDIRTPKVIDTFYWRMLIRGYPAPSFNFRWCVHLLKEKPANLDSIEETMFTGLREAESSERRILMRKKYGNSCSASPGGCMAYYYSTEGKGNKVAPMRDWTDGDVWSFLTLYRNTGGINISPIFMLYPNPKVRYGCWHCTLASVQWGLQSLGGGLEYFEAVRILYRKFSDLPYLRIKKNTGYSKLGPLNAAGRALMLKSIALAEDLSNVKLYGLDINLLEGKSIRDILFNLDPKEATALIKKYDPNIPRFRYIPIDKIRNIQKYKELALRALIDVKRNCANDKAYILLDTKLENPLITLLNRIEDLLS